MIVQGPREKSGLVALVPVMPVVACQLLVGGVAGQIGAHAHAKASVSVNGAWHTGPKMVVLSALAHCGTAKRARPLTVVFRVQTAVSVPGPIGANAVLLVVEASDITLGAYDRMQWDLVQAVMEDWRWCKHVTLSPAQHQKTANMALGLHGACAVVPAMEARGQGHGT